MSDIISQLKALKLHGMADSYAELQSQGATGATASMEPSVWLLRHLLEAESTDRAIRSIRYQVNAAKFPVHRNLAGFDFSQSKVDAQLITRLPIMGRTERGTGRWHGNRKNTFGNGHRCRRHPVSRQTGTLLLHGGLGQYAGTGEGCGQAGRVIVKCCVRCHDQAATL